MSAVRREACCGSNHDDIDSQTRVGQAETSHESSSAARRGQVTQPTTCWTTPGQHIPLTKHTRKRMIDSHAYALHVVPHHDTNRIKQTFESTSSSTSAGQR